MPDTETRERTQTETLNKGVLLPSASLTGSILSNLVLLCVSEISGEKTKEVRPLFNEVH